MTLSWVNETSLLLRLNTPPGPGQTLWLLNLVRHLQARFPDAIEDSVPAYDTLLLVFTPDAVCSQQDWMTEIDALVTASASDALTGKSADRREVLLPAWYDRRAGADLDQVASRLRLSVSQVIALHTQTTYHVYANGFAPGFAFMGDLPDRLVLPRLSTPRAHVPRGSVAIAEHQTAVYPCATPGGWHLIGRCPLRLFHPEQNIRTANRLQPGDRVRFEPIDPTRFEQLREFPDD